MRHPRPPKRPALADAIERLLDDACFAVAMPWPHADIPKRSLTWQNGKQLAGLLRHP